MKLIVKVVCPVCDSDDFLVKEVIDGVVWWKCTLCLISAPALDQSEASQDLEGFIDEVSK